MRDHATYPLAFLTYLYLPSSLLLLLHCSVPRRAGGSRNAVPGRGPQHLQARRPALEEAVQGQRPHLPGQEVQPGEFKMQADALEETMATTAV